MYRLRNSETGKATYPLVSGIFIDHPLAKKYEDILPPETEMTLCTVYEGDHPIIPSDSRKYTFRTIYPPYRYAILSYNELRYIPDK